MKIRHIAYIIIISVCLAACAKNDTDADQQNELQQEESVTTDETQPDTEDGEGETQDTSETHLELAEMEDYAPLYTLTFRKIEGGTGKELPFEGNTDPDSDDPRVPYNVSVEPEDSVLEQIAYFEGDENPAEAVGIEFWSRGDADSFLITLDGLEYTFSIPKADVTEISQKQEVNVNGATALLESASVYPNALLLKLTGVGEDFWQQCSRKVFLLIENGDDVGAASVRYEESDGTILLLHEWEDGVPKDGVSLRIKSLGAGVEEYQDYPIVLE